MEGKQKPGLLGSNNISGGAQTKQTSNWGTLLGRTRPLNIPPKVRTFMWRACLDGLPTKANLARRKVRIDDRCSICCQQNETTCHILWECPLARNVWALVRGQLQKSNSTIVNFLMLARQMMERLDRKELEVWSITAWSIWNARNRVQFKQV